MWGASRAPFTSGGGRWGRWRKVDVAGARAEVYADAAFGCAAPVGAATMGLSAVVGFIGAGNQAAVDEGVGAKVFDGFDLDLDAEAVDLEVLAADADDHFACGVCDLARDRMIQSPSETDWLRIGRVNRFIAGEPMKPATKALTGSR
jgi:hypothetical protein